jgi:hypothetical protein
MDHRRRVISSIKDAEEMHSQILDAAIRTVAFLRNCNDDPMALLKRLRFDLVGHDPLTGEPLNVVEQLNQTFTILATLKAVEELIKLHPDAGGYPLALGTCGGRDIESVENGLVAAEVFSATHPNSNQKLRKEKDRLATDASKYRYVFFASPCFSAGRHKELETPETGVHVYATEAL